jgi:hypothetical protein
MKKTKPRKTLAKEIKKTAQGDGLAQAYEAFQLATFGRPLTDYEELFRMYYHAKAAINKPPESRKFWEIELTINRPGIEKIKTNIGTMLRANLIYSKARLNQIFMSAMDAQDFQTIQELANAVRFLKDIKYPSRAAADPDREKLLALKLRIQTGGKIMTLREVAEFLKNSISLYSPEDGFSALRRKCHGINLPLAPSRKISKK